MSFVTNTTIFCKVRNFFNFNRNTLTKIINSDLYDDFRGEVDYVILKAKKVN